MKKAQAAMEYLMTYGWAIIIVIIVAAALYAMGLFSPGQQSIATGFDNIGKPSPGAWELTTTGAFTVLLGNNAPYAINLTSVTVDVGATSCTGVQVNAAAIPPIGVDIGMGADFNITATCGTPISGSVFNAEISMSGTNDKGLSFRENGKVTGTVI